MCVSDTFVITFVFLVTTVSHFDVVRLPGLMETFCGETEESSEDSGESVYLGGL